MSDMQTIGRKRNFDDMGEETGGAVAGTEEGTSSTGESGEPGGVDQFISGDVRNSMRSAPTGVSAGDDHGEDSDPDTSEDGDGMDSQPPKKPAWNAPFSQLNDRDENGDNPFQAVLPTAWRPSMGIRPYIGTTDMLLQYLRSMEEQYRMTMPIHACGIDPVVFDTADYVDPDQRFFSVASPNENASEDDDADEARIYELVKVDGELYMSCISDFLNREYFEQVITIATCSIKEHGVYEFPLVGLRALGERDDRDLLNTMRLNSFELNALISYMSQFDGIDIDHVLNADNHQCIRFQLTA